MRVNEAMVLCPFPGKARWRLLHVARPMLHFRQYFAAEKVHIDNVPWQILLLCFAVDAPCASGIYARSSPRVIFFFGHWISTPDTLHRTIRCR